MNKGHLDELADFPNNGHLLKLNT